MIPPKKIYGLIGYPVKHSLSPAMHNAGFKHCGINAQYRLFEIAPQDLEEFLRNPDKEIIDTKGVPFKAGDIEGFNITIPHKVRAKEIIMGIIPDGRIKGSRDILVAGAINTAKRENNRLVCYNTDIKGFIRALKEDLKFDPRGKTVLLMGCGGAGRAIVSGLTAEGIEVKKIYISDNNAESVTAAQKHFSQFDFLKGKLEFIDIEQVPKAVDKSQLLVNSSPVGMKDSDGTVINKDFLRRDLFVYDIVYNRQTRLVKDAQSLGITVCGGLGMLLYQGAASWELWTGKNAPVDVMRQALESAVSGK